ncbi:MAG TPA: hypothetical protein VKH13_07795 [Steroidobacteraceae bacterium]|nr:hypothetical protein [Steroidobacteraceae bacterium]
MKRLCLSGVLLTMGLFAEAHAVGRLADVSVIDRDSGCALATHYYRGEYWVAGSPGARYAIEIRNRLGERVLAVTSVDGINVVSGATAGWGQTGYVFGAGEDYQITGWRKSDSDIAAFAFTPSPNSYAERTGRPANVGIIGVALFRERLAAVVPEISRLGEVASASPAPAAPTARAADSFAKSSGNIAYPAYQTPAPKLGTAHGQRESSWVTHTEFERLQTEPNEIVRIRYDSMENLVAMGIVPPHGRTPTGPNAFPGVASRAYVPDPPS